LNLKAASDSSNNLDEIEGSEDVVTTDANLLEKRQTRQTTEKKAFTGSSRETNTV